MTPSQTRRRHLLVTASFCLLLAPTLLALAGNNAAGNNGNKQVEKLAVTTKQDSHHSSQISGIQHHQQHPQQQHHQQQLHPHPHQNQNQQQPQQQQQIADKKQGDQNIDGLFNNEEYVQIKPEEISGDVSDLAGKDIDAAALLALSDAPNQAQATTSQQVGAKGAAPQASGQAAEHKSAADDELSAHLISQDSIGALESAAMPYAAAAVAQPPAADPRAARPTSALRDGYLQSRYPRQPPPPPHPSAYARPGPKRPAYPVPAGPPSARYTQPQSTQNNVAPPHSGYITLKGKLANGLGSMVPHSPRPAYGGHAPQQSAYNQPSSGAVPHPPRYLPRGAAAGYAAFREFVRAQANRYKGQPHALDSHEPIAYNAAQPTPDSPRGVGSSSPKVPSGAYAPSPAARPYDGAESGAPPSPPPPPPPPPPQAPPVGPSDNAYGGPNRQPDPAASYAPARSKVTVAQAYIPHLTHQAQPNNYAAGNQPAASGNSPNVAYGQASQVLEKLYGGHAPQGVGKPEYSKDFGMVIHYPQATVYTEPMTVDQLHKLAGSSITQILEQLQHNLVTGQRDESNTIRSNNKHHLGSGVTIHAKEYYAPGKNGQYVPTTAAVISTRPNYQQQESTEYHQNAGSAPNYFSGGHNLAAEQPAQAYGMKPELGTGYERVKAAVAASASGSKYGPASSLPPRGPPHQASNEYGGPPGQKQNGVRGGKPANSYGSGTGNALSIRPYEPLGAIANIIGSELESLYNKANSVLAKQIDPEIHAHVQAHLRTLSKVASPLKFSDHDYKSPLMLRPHGGGPQAQAPQPNFAYNQAPQAHNSNGPPAQAPYRQPHARGRSPPRRPSKSYGGPPPSPQGPYQPSGPPPPPPVGRYPQQSGGRPHQQQQQLHYNHPSGQYAQHNKNRQRPPQYHQPQSAAYNAEQQAFQQQMNQLLNDFNLGEDNYGAKSQPAQAANQGYPNKVMQKYQQQTGASARPYELNDGLEIPQGPNDQIGEISELIDALKGTLETRKTTQQENGAGTGYQAPASNSQGRDYGKLEDVRYLSAALGQGPSYAMQVPVVQQEHQPAHSSGENAVYESGKREEPQNYQQQQQQPTGYAQAQAVGHQQAHQPQQAHQLPYLAPPAPRATQPFSHESTAAESPQANSYQAQQDYQNYQQQQQQQPSSYSQFQQSATGFGQASASAAAGDSYESVQQQEQQPESYSSVAQAVAAAQPAASPADYGKASTDGAAYGQQQNSASSGSSAGYEAPAQSGSTYQPQQQQHAVQAATAEQSQGSAAAQQQPSYSTSEHSQVINHLVPVQQAQTSASGAPDYSSQQQHHPSALSALTTSVSHQPANQITLAAPTESQYQSAQSLSSFVDSLPSDYQELLREPAGPSVMDSYQGHHRSQQHSQDSRAYSNATMNDIIKTSASSPVAALAPAHQRLQQQQGFKQHDSAQHHVGSASSVSSTYVHAPKSSSATSSSSISVSKVISSASSPTHSGSPPTSSSTSTSSASLPSSASSSKESRQEKN